MPGKLSRFRNDGSILLEAVFAVIIFSTSMTVIIQSIAGSMSSVAGSARYQEALNIMENAIADLKSGVVLPAHGSYKGNAVEYTVDITTVPAPAGSPEGLSVVSAGIKWNTGRGAKQVVSHMYVCR